LPRVIGRLLLAALALAAGLYIALFPGVNLAALTLVLVILFFASGAVRLAVGLRERGHPGAGAVAFSGILGILVAVLILLSFPESAFWALGLLMGVDLIFFGFTAITAASAGRDAAAAGG
jgi:uncharacterized membrane protein HdeD (DUF308 family)